MPVICSPSVIRRAPTFASTIALTASKTVASPSIRITSPDLSCRISATVLMGQRSVGRSSLNALLGGCGAFLVPLLLQRLLRSLLGQLLWLLGTLHPNLLPGSLAESLRCGARSRYPAGEGPLSHDRRVL